MAKVFVTSPNKYLMLDIVKYTQGRSVEAQQDIIEKLNEIVKAAVKAVQIPAEKVRYLPTGDGICIVLIAVDGSYDLEVQLGLEILKTLEIYNGDTTDEMRQFKIRIGINANTDNQVTDINGDRNFAGAGINMVQRIMNEADGNQIMTGQSTYEILAQREKYMKNLKRYYTRVKHGTPLTVYQLTLENEPGLDTSIPQQFVHEEKAPERLSMHNAYYFAHALKHRDFLLSLYRHGMAPDTAQLLLWLLAGDSVGAVEATAADPYEPRVGPSATATIREQFEYYTATDSWLIFGFRDGVVTPVLGPLRQYFEDGNRHYLYPNDKGREKLKAEWPGIWEEFGFE